MKKLFSLVAVLMAVIAMNAATQVTFDFTDATAYGYDQPAAGKYAQVKNGAVLTKDDVTITITFTSGSGFRFFAAQADGAVNLRGYAGATFTIAAPDGKKLSAITADGKNITASYLSGDMTTKNWTSAEGVASLTSNVTQSTVQFNSLKITLEADDEVYDTLTVAQAKAIADTLAKGTSSEKKYYVEGFAVHADVYKTVYGTQDFFMVDDVNAPDSSFQAFRSTPKKDKQAYAVVNGDQVRAFGKLKKYVDGNDKVQLELDKPSVEFITEAEGDHSIPPIQYDTINVARALVIGDSIGDGKTTSGQYVIDGYVTALTDNYGNPTADGGWEQYKNQSMWVADTYDETAITKEKAFFVYQGVAPEQVTKGAKIRVTCAIKNYKGMIETSAAKGAVTILEKGEDPEPPAVPDTITVARALEIGDSIGAGKTTSEKYVVDGYVIRPESFNQTKKSQTWTMSDDAAATSASATFKAFGCVPVSGNDTLKVLKGDKVRLCGAIQNYNGTIEISYAKAEFLSMVEGDHSPSAPDPVQDKVDTITVARALEIGETLAISQASDSLYVIAGYVSNIVKRNESDSTETFWMVDTIGKRYASNATGAFEVYLGKMDTTIAELDAKVYVTAKVYKYQAMKDGQPSGSPVIETSNSPIPQVHVAEAGHPEVFEPITVAQALEIGWKLQQSDKDHSYPSELGYEITGYVSYIEEAYSSYGNETFWITDEPGVQAKTSADGAFEVYRGVPDIKKEIGLGAKIKIQCHIKNFGGKTIENDGTNVPFEVLEQGTDLKYDTITVKEAVAMAADLEEGATSFFQYVVKGYIAEITTVYDPGYGNMTISLTDKFNKRTGELSCYRAKIAKDDVEKAVEGAYVYVFGNVQNYGGNPQMAQGGQITIATAPKVDTVTVTVAGAVEVAAKLEKGAEADDFYEVIGYVAKIQKTADGTQTFWMSDSEEATTGELYINVARIEAPAELHQQVRVYGWISKDVMNNPVINSGAAEVISGEGIEQLVLTEKAKKVMVDGVIYIIRDNKLFNLQGAQVR